MKDLSSVPWAQMPVYGSARAHSSLIDDDVLVTGAPGSDSDEDFDGDTVTEPKPETEAPATEQPNSDEQPKEADTSEGP